MDEDVAYYAMEEEEGRGRIPNSQTDVAVAVVEISRSAQNSPIPSSLTPLQEGRISLQDMSKDGDDLQEGGFPKFISSF
eukprot:760886-Hanusia_phi.AAC.2